MVAASARAPTLRFTGSLYLRERLVLSVLSGRAVRFDGVRAGDAAAPGLSAAEMSFVRLLDKLTHGSSVEINETGTTLRFRPGVLSGHAGVRAAHDCHPSRGVGYYAEPLLMLAPFCKRPLALTLRGPTHAPRDRCADTLAAVSVPLLRRLTLGTPLEPELNVVRRGAASGGLYAGGKGGCVVFKCGVLSAKIAPVELMDRGVVKRVRGIAFANRVSPAFVSGVVDGVRGGLNPFTPDVYVHTDHGNAADGGAGFGVHLVAETTEGCLLAADWTSVGKGETAAAVAKCGVNMLLDQVAQGGCVDADNSCLALLMCAVADSDVSRVRLGRLTEQTVQFLRDLKAFFGVTFKVKVDVAGEESDESEEEEEEESTDGKKDVDPIFHGIVMSCIGIGLENTARQRF